MSIIPFESKAKTDKVKELIIKFDVLRKQYLSEQSELRANYSDEFVSILQQLNELDVDYNLIDGIDLNIIKLAMSKENLTN